MFDVAAVTRTLWLVGATSSRTWTRQTNWWRKVRRPCGRARRHRLLSKRPPAGMSFVIGRVGEHKDLARIDEIGVADLVPVRVDNDRIAHALSIGRPTNAPQVVAPSYDG